MNILLPKTRFGLAAALNKTNIWAFQTLLTNTVGTYIEATIPKFDIDTPFNFERYFKSEGLEFLIAKPPPKDEKTLKAEWETYYRRYRYRPEVQHVYVSAITIGMDESGSHINRESPIKSKCAPKDTYDKKMNQKSTGCAIIMDHRSCKSTLQGQYYIPEDSLDKLAGLIEDLVTVHKWNMEKFPKFFL